MGASARVGAQCSANRALSFLRTVTLRHDLFIALNGIDA